MSDGIGRRRMMAWAVGACAAALLGAARIAGAAEPATGSRVNVLVAVNDDQSFQHTGMAGCKTVATPAFDRIAREGVYFTNAYCAAPTCTASRGAMLTGQAMWRLGSGANLHGTLDHSYAVYPDLLEKAGYVVGFTGKGWGPGDFAPGGRTRNPAGNEFNASHGAGAAVKNFRAFMNTRAAGQPFCFWLGSHDPHRMYVAGSGLAAGKKLADADVPPYLPDSPEVRGDILDYCAAVDRADRDLGDVLKALEDAGELEHTLVIATSDNGWPFPRAKANLYTAGTHMPLAVRWPGHGKGRRVVDDFVNLVDVAPTVLEAAGLPVPADMTGRGWLTILNADKGGRVDETRDRAYFGLERHTTGGRAGQVGYPCRAVRTADYLYIHNDAPDRWPAGDPPRFGDIDPATNRNGPGPTKQYLLDHRDAAGVKELFELACAKRPAEELYDLRKDPWEMKNVAQDPKYAKVKAELSRDLAAYRERTKDPRATGGAMSAK